MTLKKLELINHAWSKNQCWSKIRQVQGVYFRTSQSEEENFQQENKVISKIVDRAQIIKFMRLIVVISTEKLAVKSELVHFKFLLLLFLHIHEFFQNRI
jgi:hypothetical protein